MGFTMTYPDIPCANLHVITMKESNHTEIFIDNIITFMANDKVFLRITTDKVLVNKDNQMVEITDTQDIAFSMLYGL